MRRPAPPTSFAVTLGGLFVLGIMAVAGAIYAIVVMVRRAIEGAM